MKDFLSLAKARHSCRSYSDQAIPEDVLGRILESGRVCPTAHNNQPYQIFVLQNDTPALEKIRTAGRIYKAPVTMVICGDRDQAWVNSFNQWKSTEVDATIITDHMLLAAASENVDSLWICWFDDKIVREALDLTENLVPVNILLMGYGDKEKKSPDRHEGTRKALDEIVKFL